MGVAAERAPFFVEKELSVETLTHIGRSVQRIDAFSKAAGALPAARPPSPERPESAGLGSVGSDDAGSTRRSECL